MKEKLLTKTEIYYALKDGKRLNKILKLRDGQECTIFKEDDFPDDPIDYNKVIYIPDMELNEIPYDRIMTMDEVACTYSCLYTAGDFIDICNGDKAIAKEIFYGGCDWAHPSSEYEQMDQEGLWSNDE